MTIVIVDDDTMLVEALAMSFAQLGHRILGVASAPPEARKLILQTEPELVLLDVYLRHDLGLRLIPELRRAGSAAKFIAISGQCHAGMVMMIANFKPDGFIFKPSLVRPCFAHALKALAEGRAYYSPEFLALQQAQRMDTDFFGKKLSNRELEVLSLVGDGLDANEIATSIGTSPRTAETHRSHILRKLGIGSTPKLMAFAIRHGFDKLCEIRFPFERERPKAADKPK